MRKKPVCNESDKPQWWQRFLRLLARNFPLAFGKALAAGK
jgi:hypothetical protein